MISYGIAHTIRGNIGQWRICTICGRVGKVINSHRGGVRSRPGCANSWRRDEAERLAKVYGLKIPTITHDERHIR